MFWFWRRWGHRVRRRYRAASWRRDDFQRDVSGGNRSKRTLLETAFQQLLDLFQESERFPASLWGQNQETQNTFSSPGPSVCRNVVPTFILVMGYNFWKVLTNWFMFEFEGVWRNEQEEAFGCQITGNWIQVLLELHLVFSSSVPAWCSDSRSSSFTSYFPFACSSIFHICLLIFPPSLLLTSPSHLFHFVLHELRVKVSKLSWVTELIKLNHRRIL